MEKIHAGESWREMFGGVVLALRWVVGQAGRFDSLLVSNRRICMGFPTANTF